MGSTVGADSVSIHPFGRLMQRKPTHIPRINFSNREKIKARLIDAIEYGSNENNIDLRGLEQIVEIGQTRAIAYAIHRLASILQSSRHQNVTLKELIDTVEEELSKGENGGRLDYLFNSGGYEDDDGPTGPNNFSRPRIQEIIGALNRLRNIHFALC